MSARENQLSRWGAVSKVLEKVSPYSKVFFVGDSDDTGFVDFVNQFPPDKDGVVRVYGSMFDATLLANLRANRGDVVLVMPGHSEAITSDQSLNVNGAKFIGLGEGDERPQIVYNDTAASISLDTAGIHFENFRLPASVSGITRAIDIAGAGCVVRKNTLEFEATGDDFMVGIRATGVARPTIEENEILGENAAGAVSGIVSNGAQYAKIRNNFIFGDFTGAAISLDSTDTSSGVRLINNEVINMDSDGIVVAAAAGTTGIAANNRFGTGDTVEVAAGIVAGNLRWIENYLVNDSAETGTLVPRTASTT